jgi:hypothetical protein
VKLAVCFALALVGCGGTKAALPVGADLASAPAGDLAGVDLAQLGAGGDLAGGASDVDMAMSSSSTDMATPPDLWMCVPTQGNCSTLSECCDGNLCAFPIGGPQPQHVCCGNTGHACQGDGECCYNPNGVPGATAYCNLAHGKCELH